MRTVKTSKKSQKKVCAKPVEKQLVQFMKYMAEYTCISHAKAGSIGEIINRNVNTTRLVYLVDPDFLDALFRSEDPELNTELLKKIPNAFSVYFTKPVEIDKEKVCGYWIWISNDEKFDGALFVHSKMLVVENGAVREREIFASPGDPLQDTDEFIQADVPGPSGPRTGTFIQVKKDWRKISISRMHDKLLRLCYYLAAENAEVQKKKSLKLLNVATGRVKSWGLASVGPNEFEEMTSKSKDDMPVGRWHQYEDADGPHIEWIPAER